VAVQLQLGHADSANVGRSDGFNGSNPVGIPVTPHPLPPSLLQTVVAGQKHSPTATDGSVNPVPPTPHGELTLPREAWAITTTNMVARLALPRVRSAVRDIADVTREVGDQRDTIVGRSRVAMLPAP
jgi:hypothetical protein